MTDWRTDRPTDWPTDWLTDRPTKRLTNRSTNWPTDWMTNRSINRPTDWLTDWLPDLHTYEQKVITGPSTETALIGSTKTKPNVILIVANLQEWTVIVLIDPLEYVGNYLSRKLCGFDHQCSDDIPGLLHSPIVGSYLFFFYF